MAEATFGTAPAPAATRPVAARGAVAPVMVITVFMMLLPIAREIGGLYMTPMRALYVVTVPYLMIRLMRGDAGRLVLVDWLVFGYVFWMAVTVWINHPSQLFTFTGSTGLTVLGGYLAARVTVRSAADFIAFARFMAWVVVLILLPMGAWEAIGKDGPVLINWLRGSSWFYTYEINGYCCRWGLYRAQTVFIHPIHNGIFCSIPFAFYFTGLTNHHGFWRRGIMAGLIVLATFASISSGAVLTVGFQGMLCLYAMLLYNNPQQWRMFGYGAASAYLLLELNSTKFAFLALAEKLAFSSWNVYIRGLLYNAGITQIKQTPIFGFGYNRLPALPYWMTGSTDNYWLQQGVSHGIPGFALPFGAFMYAILRSGRNGFTKGSDLYHIRLGYAFTLTGLVLAMTTVAVWAEAQSAVFLALGAGVFLFHAHEDTGAAAKASATEAPQTDRRPAYTRFPDGAPSPLPARTGAAPAAAGRAQRSLRRTASEEARTSAPPRLSRRRP